MTLSNWPVTDTSQAKKKIGIPPTLLSRNGHNGTTMVTAGMFQEVDFEDAKSQNNCFCAAVSKGEWSREAQLWEHSPPTNVARVRIQALTPYVGWVCRWLSPLLREVFLRGLRFAPLLKNQHFQISVRYIHTYFIVTSPKGLFRNNDYITLFIINNYNT